jgi:hypothetical protein
MGHDTTVKDGFVDTVLRQIDSGEPPIARETYDRLIDEGHSNNETLHLMAAALRTEMKQMLDHSKPFDNDHYAALLKKLPAL